MIKQPITYVDFNGEERTEDFYFHLSMPEVVRLEAKIGASLDEHSKKLAKDKDLDGMITFLENVVLSAYGIKSEDGRSFKKNEDLRSEFENSNAYAELFQMLLTQPELASKFGAGVADNGKKTKNRVTPNVELSK